MTVLSSIDILDEPDALSEEECTFCAGHPWTICGDCGRDGYRNAPLYCLHCDNYGCRWCDPNYDPTPPCNCGTCPDGGPFTCVRED